MQRSAVSGDQSAINFGFSAKGKKIKLVENKNLHSRMEETMPHYCANGIFGNIRIRCAVGEPLPWSLG